MALTPRVDLNLANFEQLLTMRGYNLVHYKSLLCPCIDSESHAPDPTCPLCDKGYQYYGEENIVGLMTGVSAEKQFTDAGGFFLGTVQLTVLPTVTLSYHDRIIHTDSIMSYNDMIQSNGPGGVDKAKFPIISPTFCISTQNGVNTTYTLGVDYSVSGNQITWLSGGNSPAQGAYYSLVYTCHPSWLVVSFLHLVRDINVAMPAGAGDGYQQGPVQALCKLEFLLDEYKS